MDASSVTGISIFPTAGRERRYDNPDKAAEELESCCAGPSAAGLCGEVPLSCYLSGGLDSTVILGLSSQERGEPIPSFTIGLDKSGPSRRAEQGGGIGPLSRLETDDGERDAGRPHQQLTRTSSAARRGR